MSTAAVVDWTEAELALLREHYPVLGAPGVLPMLPGRTRKAVEAKAQRLQLRCKGAPWTPEQDAVLRQLYPQGGSAPVAKAIGRNAKSVSERAKRLGVRCEVKNIGAIRRWQLRRDLNGPSPTAVRLRKPAPVWPRMIDKPQACAEPIRTDATRVTVAPPPAERFAVASAPRVVNPDECRPWARLVASGARA